MSLGGGGGGTNTIRENREPWGPVQPHLIDAVEEAAGLYETDPRRGFDPLWYLQNNPDVLAAIGVSPEILASTSSQENTSRESTDFVSEEDFKKQLRNRYDGELPPYWRSIYRARYGEQQRPSGDGASSTAVLGQQLDSGPFSGMTLEEAARYHYDTHGRSEGRQGSPYGSIVQRPHELTQRGLEGVETIATSGPSNQFSPMLDLVSGVASGEGLPSYDREEYRSPILDILNNSASLATGETQRDYMGDLQSNIFGGFTDPVNPSNVLRQRAFSGNNPLGGAISVLQRLANRGVMGS